MTVDHTAPDPGLPADSTSGRPVLDAAARAGLRRHHAMARTTRVWRPLADRLLAHQTAGISPDELAGILGVDPARIHHLRVRYATPPSGPDRSLSRR